MDQIESLAQFSLLKEKWNFSQCIAFKVIHHTLQCDIISRQLRKQLRPKCHLYFTPQQFITVTNEPVTQMNKLK